MIINTDQTQSSMEVQNATQHILAAHTPQGKMKIYIKFPWFCDRSHIPVIPQAAELTVLS